MFNHAHVVRNAFITGTALLSMLIVSTELRAQTDCPNWLEEPTGATSLASGGSTTREKGVDEWDGEILRFTTTLPGVITVEGNGPEFDASLYTGTELNPMVDSAEVGTSLPALETVVPAGNHCIEVAQSSEDNYGVQVSFTDVCHLGDADDHGDSFLCATSLTVGGGNASGQISSYSTTDIDRFKFYVSSPANIKIESGGTTDVEAELFEEDGTPIGSDDNSGEDDNFKILYPSLPQGWYYVRVRGANGSYTVNAATYAP